ncbi:hypothetical protein [Streptomyces sp. NPDC008150]|uniref:hypothetical protein n=1 Tax=Streptomyces sp. NPDC008150 TaxID=3364816 RepID=UPI0036EB4E1F
MDALDPDAPGPSRHLDQGYPLARFAARMLVVCPRCGGRAETVPLPGLPAVKYHMEHVFRPRRLACGACGHTADWTPRVRDGGLVGVALGGTEDPFFRRPLWLQTRCAGRILWAFDAEHVDELSAYVGARLRESGPLSPTRAMIPRLPAWLKRADNRQEVLAGLRRLRELARRSAPADRSDAAYERGDRPRPHRSTYFTSR